MRIKAYYADAAIYCPDCADEIYTAHCACCGLPAEHITQLWHNYHDCLERYLDGHIADDMTRFFGGSPPPGRGAFIAIDNEGNMVSASFGGSEMQSDSPSHCSICHEFLENPLTDDGDQYVLDALQDATGDPEVLETWRLFYDYLDTEKEVQC